MMLRLHVCLCGKHDFLIADCLIANTVVFHFMQHVSNVSLVAGMNMDNVYLAVEIWKNSFKISEGKYDLCTGIDDEFYFCGALKGGKSYVYSMSLFFG